MRILRQSHSSGSVYPGPDHQRKDGIIPRSIADIEDLHALSQSCCFKEPPGERFKHASLLLESLCLPIGAARYVDGSSCALFTHDFNSFASSAFFFSWHSMLVPVRYGANARYVTIGGRAFRS